MKNEYIFSPLRSYEAGQIKAIRNGLGMTQVVFAMLLGVSKKTVEAWESGRNMPDGPARRLLEMIEEDPSSIEKYKTHEDSN